METMMHPSFLMTQMNVAEPIKTEIHTDEGMVPTTVDGESDPGYNSDSGFYPNDGREKNSSGASTPLTIDDNMETWHDQYANNLMLSADPTLTQNYPSIYTNSSANSSASTHQDQVVFMEKTAENTVTENNNNFTKFNNNESYYNGYDGAANEDVTDDYSGEELEGSDILKRPVKGMSAEDKKLRRRELNRLAAQRSRQKKKSTSSTLAEQSVELVKKNDELRKQLGSLETAKIELYDMIKNHFKKCSSKTPNIIIPKPEYPHNAHHQHLPTVVAPRASVAGYTHAGYQTFNGGVHQLSGGD